MARQPVEDSHASAIGVVTVSYGSGDVLRGFLASIAASSRSPLSIVVVDNLPEGDAVVRRLAEAANAHYQPMASNVGYGAAMNAGVAALPPEIEWVLLSNPDVVLGAGAVDALLAVGAEDPAIASVGPEILTSDGDIYPSARAVPSLRAGVGHALFVNLWVDNPWTRAYRNVYEPSAVVTHSGAHSTTSDSGRMISAHHDSARRFLNQKYAGAVLWPIRISLTIGLRLRSALVRRRATRQ